MNENITLKRLQMLSHGCQKTIVVGNSVPEALKLEMYSNITQRNRNWPPITITTILIAGRVVNRLCEIYNKIFAIHIFRMEDSAVWNGQRTFASEPRKCANSIFLHTEKNQNMCSVFSILHQSRVKILKQ
jgi:hypothetical protein